MATIKRALSWALMTLCLIPLVALLGYFGAGVANICTLEEKSVSKVYSTEDISFVGLQELVVQGDRYAMNAQGYSFLRNHARGPARQFVVRSMDGCIGMTVYRPEEKIINLVRLSVR